MSDSVDPCSEESPDVRAVIDEALTRSNSSDVWQRNYSRENKMFALDKALQLMALPQYKPPRSADGTVNGATLISLASGIQRFIERD